VRDKITERLRALGYKVTEADDWLIDFLISSVTQTIKNECNIDAVPDGLRHVAIDMVTGEFLRVKKASGGLEDFDMTTAVQNIRLGDAKVGFSVDDDALTLDGLIQHLIEGNRSQLTAFRRLRW